jgi:hypothetical protein
MKYLPDNVHCNTLHSSCNTSVSTCDVTYNERTLDLRPYPKQHSTSALSTINLTAAHKRYHRKTQQTLPTRTHGPLFPATACLYLKYCACSILMKYLKCTGHPNVICINISYHYPNSGATFGFWNFILCWRKVYMEILHILAKMLLFIPAVNFLHTFASSTS